MKGRIFFIDISDVNIFPFASTCSSFIFSFLNQDSVVLFQGEQQAMQHYTCDQILLALI